MRCSAKSGRTGRPCRQWAIRGGNVCRTHGGLAPQVKRKAEERIERARLQMVGLLDPAFDVYEAQLAPAQVRRNPPVAVAIARDVFDRNDIKPASRVAISGPGGGPIEVNTIQAILLAAVQAKLLRLLVDTPAPEPAALIPSHGNGNGNGNGSGA